MRTVRRLLTVTVIAVLLGASRAASVPHAQVADPVMSTVPAGSMAFTPRLTTIALHIESTVDDITSEQFAATALSVLNDARGWTRAGFRFVSDDDSQYRLILAEPRHTDSLCSPLQTKSLYSCQNGVVVALNAARYRQAPDFWSTNLDDYRRYMFNHEVGHLFGQRHPVPRCPTGGRAAVMEQQTKGLHGCLSNPWPLPWEIRAAASQPGPVMAPPPDWDPNPQVTNPGDRREDDVASASLVPSNSAVAASLVADSSLAGDADGDGTTATPVVTTMTVSTSSAMVRQAPTTVPMSSGDPERSAIAAGESSGRHVKRWLASAVCGWLAGGGVVVVSRRNRRRNGHLPIHPGGVEETAHESAKEAQNGGVGQ